MAIGILSAGEFAASPASDEVRQANQHCEETNRCGDIAVCEIEVRHGCTGRSVINDHANDGEKEGNEENQESTRYPNHRAGQ